MQLPLANPDHCEWCGVAVVTRRRGQLDPRVGKRRRFCCDAHRKRASRAKAAAAQVAAAA